MIEILSFIAAPFALAILLVGIHAYLGLHVLERDVIFVDISLSQVAALGGVISLSISEKAGEGALGILFSLGLCLFAALALSLLRHYEKNVSQEALIGMTYALASGALILVMDRLPHAAEHLKEALVGNILFVTWPKVFETFIIYSVIGLIHYIFRKQFWACSRGETSSPQWDFLFYLLFGVVITFSTHHAGVLVVFSILVVPASFAKRMTQGLTQRLFLSWGFGLLGILFAFFASYHFDLPAGAAIVTTLTASFFIFLTIKLVLERAHS
ncbi:MAG: metal ABC transporter permease [Bdellovibrionales bacterium]|nr:metal ABC transporter permease [Bdellovibrionales bacterium]